MIQRTFIRTDVKFGYGKLGISIGNEPNTIVIQEFYIAQKPGETVEQNSVDATVPPVILNFLNGSGIDILIGRLQELKERIPKEIIDAVREPVAFAENVVQFKPKKRVK